MRMMVERGDTAVRQGVFPMARDSQKPGEEPGPDSSIPGEGDNPASAPVSGCCGSPDKGADDAGNSITYKQAIR